MASEGSSPPAGWYKDPANATQQRYWDGSQWTQKIKPLVAASTPVSSPVIQPATPQFTSSRGSPSHLTFTKSQRKGFFSSLFDFSFSSLVAPSIIKVIYGLALAGIAIEALFWVYIGLHAGTSLGLALVVIGVPLITLLSIVWTRVILEFLIVIFRILESNQELVELAKRGR